MASYRLAIATLVCCVLLIVEVAWGALQVRDLAREWQAAKRIEPMITITQRDVPNQSGTKVDITTAKLTVDETDEAHQARHRTAVAKWRTSTD